MRRSLAGLVLIAAWIFVALSFSGWRMHQRAFAPSSDAEATFDILSDDEIRSELAILVAAADAPTLGQSPTALREFIELVTRIPEGAALMTRFVSDAHAVVIGDLEGPVEISAAEQVTIVRDERVALNPPIALPVDKSGLASFANTGIEWVSLVSAGIGLLLLLVGALLRPESGESTLALAVGLGAFAVLNIIVGYVVPAFGIQSGDGATWVGAVSQMTLRTSTRTFTISAVTAALAVALVAATNNARQRRQRSTPLSVTRYRDQRSWSR